MAKKHAGNDELPDGLVIPSYLYRMLRKDDLAKACKSANLDDKGKKDDLIARLLVDGARLELLTNDALQTLCSKLDVSTSGNKTALVQRLDEGGLKALCQYLGLPVSGNRADMIKQIRRSKTAHQEEEETQKKDAVAKSESKTQAKNDPQKERKMGKDEKKLLQERLAVLYNDDLSEECRLRDLPVSGAKDVLVKRLVDDGLELSELLKFQLQLICFSEDLSESGTKGKLLERLKNASGSVPRKGKKEVEEKKAAVSASVKLISTSGGEAMSRNAYRELLRKAYLLEDDQDVYHIIASENGGADHTHNYHYAQNQAWNRAIGAQHDYINCFMAGKIKAQKAVAISRELGNKKGKKYTGPSADELYHHGEDVMRGIRRENRGRWADIQRLYGGSLET
ncbi:hypothetical protein KFL_001360080 [Klebsormidium nitens]|uniref:SAP domain-containing protein n=1 Tax=Klebsormidium nitens TaxID=105231 RepID=A0A1Y1I1Q8_KLENI|nr:hypothetical protein KFL_001360080 [Klebsormidium nitens]|eukprot:GAQ83111.1 hypothetical protein KFL_001360080 [Klebsormidium nitens]